MCIDGIDVLKFKLSVSDPERSMVVGGRWAGLGIFPT